MKYISWLAACLLILACSTSEEATKDTQDDQTDVSELSEIEGDTDRVNSEVPFDWCLADTPPDDACYAQKRNPDSLQIALACEIADKQLDLHDPATLGWDWEEAVLMWSLTELHRVTQDERYHQFYRDWMDHHMAEGYAISTSDTCAPAAIAAVLYAETGDIAYKQVVLDALIYLDEDAFRTPEGGISHLGTVDIVTLWVDSLFMFGNVMLAWAERGDGVDRLDDFHEQLDIFATRMQRDNGLFVHAVDWIMTPDEPVYWARGNAWVTAAVYQYLRIRVNRGETDDLAVTVAKKQVQGVLPLQDPDSGLWWNMLNKPNYIYLETSAAALFAFGMARGYRYGFCDDSVLPAIAQAVEGVVARIERDSEDRPVVTGISGPTTADKMAEYENVELMDDLGYGIGAVILALVETSGLDLPWSNNFWE